MSGVLSKSNEIVVQWLGSYLTQLYLNPVRTKSITAAVLAVAGNAASQYISGAKTLDCVTLRAFGLYGLIFGGSVPHFFYEFLRKIINERSRLAPMKMLLIERLIFMPLYQYFSLYSLSRFEGKTHAQASSAVGRIYLPIVEANLRYLSILQFLNMYFVPPMLRVLVMNLVAFFWIIFLTRKRAAISKNQSSKTNKDSVKRKP